MIWLSAAARLIKLAAMNPVALVTGASRGIGRGIALEMARLGCDLAINFAREEAAARQTAADCESAASAMGKTIRARICQADIGDSEARARLVDFTVGALGRIDVLVNNAGVAPAARQDILEATEESFDRLLRINAKGPYFLTQRVARVMIAQRQQPVPPGFLTPKIITISSISAYTASVNRGDYCVSKAALSMLTPLFAARLAEHGITVFEVRPGIIATDMTEPVKEKYDRLLSGGLAPIARWGTPEDVGKAVVALASGSLPYSTGQVINIDGGFHLRIL